MSSLRLLLLPAPPPQRLDVAQARWDLAAMRVLVGEGGPRGKVGGGFRERRLSPSWRGGGPRGRAPTGAPAPWPWPPNPCDLGHLCMAETGAAEEGRRRGPLAGTEGTPWRTDTSCFLIRWRDGLHWDSPTPTAESPRSRSDPRLPTARPGSDHVGTSALGKLGAGRRAAPLGRRCARRALCAFLQDELAASGLPRCDAAVNLAGENILNPLRRSVSAGPED